MSTVVLTKNEMDSESILKLIQERKSTRTPFDPDRKISTNDLAAIIEAARWSPTAHNMQNFDIVVVDDPKLLKPMGEIKSRISEEFLRENYKQLSFSRREFLHKKVGILGSNFPPSWRDPAMMHEIATHATPTPLSESMQGAPVLLVVVYDPRKRAPASKGDFLGVISLGCVMENMWLVAQSLGVSFQVLSVFGGGQVEAKVKRILSIPKPLKIAYAIRLGYTPAGERAENLRVRRDPKVMAHYNSF